MKAETIPENCVCGSIGNTEGIRFCAPCHRYWNNDKELMSVSKVIKSAWPVRKNFENADPGVLMVARERGIRTDQYISQYIERGSVKIPSGEWKEVVDLVQKFVPWWKGRSGKTQTILHNEDIAGTCDLITDGGIWDIKCVWELDTSYELQLGLYGLLYQHMHKEPPAALGLIHLTKRYSEPRIVPLDVKQTMTNAATLLEMWRLVKRLTA